ncbi:MAG: phage protease [Sinobacteraceae bacterium]|nr:phage protease [Nevskiaceae bacterium]
MKLNSAAVAHARELIRSGRVDRSSSWSFSAADGNALLGQSGDDWSAYAAVHLGVDETASDKTKARWHYPVAKGGKVYLSGLRAAISRASQQGDSDIAKAAQDLLAEAKGGKAQARAQVAALTVELDSEHPDEIQLLPDGLFRARDGRPEDLEGWRLTAASARAIQAEARARKTPYVIDYEHQTLRTEANGQPAPAAGWFRELDYRPGEGLFARPEWTDRARQMIAAKEYRFISPVFGYDADTGDILALHSAALTNVPALDGMREVYARAAATLGYRDTTQEADMPDVKTALGLPEDAEESAVVQAVEALKAKAAEAEAKIAALKEPDPSKYVSTQVVEALKAEVAELRAKDRAREIEDVIQAALNDKRGPLLLPAQLDWARKLGAKDIEALREYLKTAVPVVPRGEFGRGAAPDSDDDPVALAEAAQKLVAEAAREGRKLTIAAAVEQIRSKRAAK